MRTALILAREHGEPHLAVISGPEIPVHQQVSRFKGLIVTSASHDFAEIQLWESDAGMTNRKRFKPRPDKFDLDAENPVFDLSERLAALDITTLCEIAAKHDIDLAGKAEKLDIIKAIVIGIRAKHFADPAEDKTTPPDQTTLAGDPATFDGPRLPANIVAQIQQPEQ